PVEDDAVPALDDLDLEALERMRLRTAEPTLPHVPTDVKLQEDLSAESGVPMSQYEAAELTALGWAAGAESRASFMRLLASVLSVIPTFDVALKPMGAGTGFAFGGSNLGAAMQAAAEVASAEAN